MICLPAVLKAQSNQTVNAGSQTAVVNFPVTTCTYNWVNSNQAIGLTATGTGDIAAFTATNTTGSPITATITATPVGPTPEPPLLYIPNFNANTVSVINATTYALITTVPVGTNPYGVMVSHDYNRVYVANQGSNDVSVIYMPTNRVLATIPGLSTPGAIAISSNNQIVYVANSSSNTVSVINALNNTIVNTITVGQNPVGLSLNFNGDKLYVANGDGTISVINTTTLGVTITPSIVSNPSFTLLSPDNSKLYVVEPASNQIDIISTTNNTLTGHIQVGSVPKGIAISPDGSRLYVSNSADNNIAVINTTTNSIITTINTGGTTPTGLSISDDGSLLYVTNSGNNNVSVINTTTLGVTQTINVGARPFSVGNFYLSRADCGAPITFSIIVNAANPVIITNGTPSAVATTFGTASAPATFTAGASNATGNLVVNAPAGFEVSLDNIIYFNVVTMNGPGSITPRTVYVRLKSTTLVGTYSGNIALTSPGVTTVNVIMPLSTVTAVGPIITVIGTPSSVSTTYGTPSSPTSFMVSGANMAAGIQVTPPAGFEVSIDGINFAGTVTINGTGTIPPTKIYIRLKQTTSVGTYSGNIVLSTTGAADVNVVMPASTVSQAQLIVNVQGTKVYGDTFSDFVATTSNFDFSLLNTGLKNGETVNTLDISLTGGNAATDPVGVYKNSIHTSNITGANGFLPGNYNVTYQTGPLTVTPAPLTITANNVSKTFGNTLTGGSGSTAFTITGLQNSETVSSLTMAYGNGAAANAAPGVYNGSIMPSGAVGGNGFLASNYTINYVPGNITINAAGPSITASGTLQPLTTVYGTPSSSTSFTVSGSNLTAGILVTPPPGGGFEVSTDNLTFSSTVTVGSAGTVTSLPVYIRLKQTTFVGSYFGNISLKSPGAADVNIVMPASNVTPAPLLITANAIVKTYGNILTGGAGSTAFTISGLQNSETVSSITLTYGTGAAAIANTGIYSASVIPSAAAGGTFTAGNYSITYQPGNITVTPAPLTATADSESKIYGDINPTLTITYTGFVNNDGVAQLTTQPTATTTATQASPAGQYPITVSGGIASNYTFSYVNGILTVNPVPSAIVNIPNTFTPNGDGVNDTWNINNLNTYPKITVEILNRYGTRVYFSNNYPVPWDGKYNGANVPQGTYYYIITGVSNKPLTGYVAVIR